MSQTPPAAAEALLFQVRALKEQLAMCATQADSIERQLVQATAPTAEPPRARSRPGRGGRPYLNGDTGHGPEV